MKPIDIDDAQLQSDNIHYEPDKEKAYRDEVIARQRAEQAAATSADLLELDAVPDPVDSDAPAAAYGATVGQGAVTTRHRRTERP